MPTPDQRAADAPIDSELLSDRALDEFAFCPRLFHLVHVEGRAADEACAGDDPADSTPVHRRDPHGSAAEAGPPDEELSDGDAGRRRSTQDDGDEPPVLAGRLSLDSQRLGLTATLDLLAVPAGADGAPEAVPVTRKHGGAPAVEERSYEPQRVRLMAQGLLLREHGHRCDHGVLYFAGSRTRVDVPFTPELEARTLELVEQARQASRRRDLPPPLDDSPKCTGCSLAGICLPDETLALRHVPPDDAAPEIRRLYPPRDEALPLYVQEQGASVGKSGDLIVVRKRGEELGRVRLLDVSQLVLCGNVMITAQAVHLLCEAGISIVHLSSGGWFHGVTTGMGLRNAFGRSAQFEAAARADRCLTLARELVAAKGVNQRTLLRRNADCPDALLRDMNDLIDRARMADDLAVLRGLEGALAAHYFRSFAGMLKPRDSDPRWAFTARNRRPPRDPVNALLSFGYALLIKELTVALLAEGLDPWWGMYHQPRHGRPALALDLMEPFRPLIVDSAVVTAINTGRVQSADFTCSAAGCALSPGGRRGFIRAYEARLDQLVTHPAFNYRCAWRAMIRLHARLFSRWLRGDVPRYESITTR